MWFLTAVDEVGRFEARCSPEIELVRLTDFKLLKQLMKLLRERRNEEDEDEVVLWWMATAEKRMLNEDGGRRVRG